jgi:hypothetical protein
MKIKWHEVTWYSKILALALFVALPFIGFYFGARYGETKQYVTDTFVNLKNTSSSAAASADANAYYENISEWQTDQNNAGWSIAYPIDFDTNDVYSPVSTNDWRQGTPGGPGLQPFTLTIPRMFEPQTNFSDAKLTVGMSSNSNAIAQCLVPEMSVGQNATSTIMIGGTVFTIFHFADAGAGNYYETTSYRTVHDGQCYAVEYTIHSNQIANYPPEYGLKPFDEIKLHDVLDRIVGTFQFK